MKSEGDFNQNQYNANYLQYLESNSEGKIGGTTVNERVQLFERFVPKGRKVFEIGSGGGDEAIKLQESGYKVLASDYVPKFVDILKQKGLNAIEFDAKQDPIPAGFNAVYANAVFVHFSPQELSDFLQRARQALIGEKTVFMSVIKGEGHERAARARGFERDFDYYSTEKLIDIVQKQGFDVLHTDDTDEKWIQAVITVHDDLK